MNFEHFAHKPNFFPYFPVWQGKCRQLGLRRDQQQRRALRADWITRLSRNPEGQLERWLPWTPAFEGVTQSRFSVRRVIWRYAQPGGVSKLRIFCRRDWGGDAMKVIANGAAHVSGCGHAFAGIAIAAAAAIRRRRVLAQHRLSASACSTQTARTFSRPCTRNRDMPRFLMMPCARSVSLRRR